MSKNKNIWNIISSYRLKSIFMKYFILVFIIIGFTLSAISFTVYYFYSATVEKNIKYAYEVSLNKTKDTMDMILAEGDRLAAILSTDSEVQIFLRSNYYELEGYEKKVMLNNIITKLGMSASKDDPIYLYSKNNNYIMSYKYFGHISDYQDKTWLDDFNKDTGNKRTKFYFRLQKSMEVSNPTKYDFLTTIKEIYDVESEYQGIIVINNDVTKFKKFFRDLSTSNFEDVYMIDNDNKIIFSSNKDYIGSSIEEIQSLKGFKQNTNISNVINIDGKRKLVSSLNSDKKNYKYISVVSLDKEVKAVNIRNMLIYSVAASILLSILLAFAISINIYKPFGDIITVINSPEQIGNFGLVNGKKGYNELKFILSKIVDINLNKKNMELSLAEYLTMLKKSQTIALQSQINPHFLYNTLSAINWLAIGLTKSENEASIAITNLSELLRLSLETGDNLIAIKNEVTHAQKYIVIEKIRFKNLFDVEWNIADEIKDYMVVKITLQPIIENAIYHGLKQKTGGGTIKINAYPLDECIVLEVQDNGIGLDDDVVDMINQELTKNYIQEDHNIGLRNINQRIKLIFGEKYGASILSEKGNGTTVKIVIPKIKINT